MINRRDFSKRFLAAVGTLVFGSVARSESKRFAERDFVDASNETDRGCFVYLNGKPLVHCLRANAKEGWVDAMMMTPFPAHYSSIADWPVFVDSPRRSGWHARLYGDVRIY